MASETSILTLRPDLAAQMVDQKLAARLTPGSNRTVEWRCPEHGHTWSATINNRANATTLRCPYCAGRRVLPGFNDLATTHPKLASQLVDQQIATTISSGSGRSVSWQCQVDPGHQWEATPNRRTSSRSRSSGCPYCANRKVLPGFNDLATTHPELASQLVDPALATSITPGHNGLVDWVCHRHPRPFTWATSPILRTRQHTGCPVCSQRQVVPGINDLAVTHPELTSQLADPQPDGRARQTIADTVSRGSHDILTWVCPDDPTHRWTATVKDRVRGTNCPQCANVGTSLKETQLLDVVVALVPDLPVRHQGLINGRTGRPGGSPTADILVPERRLAIEFNGLYFHSELFCSRDYHARKSALAAQAGLQLIHVWEDDWSIRPHVVIRTLAHKLHATYRVGQVLEQLKSSGVVPGLADVKLDPRISETVYARTLVPKMVPGARARQFLTDNHLQGAVSATCHFALCEPDTDDIRALLSLRSPRNNARMRRRVGQWEIQRYATLGNVPGGFTRLLAHAEKALPAQGKTLNSWISFSSADVSDGGLYYAADFHPEDHLPPDYRYVGGPTRWRRTPKERYQLRRFREDPDLTWQEGWTERDAAAHNNLHRIYDSGKTRWVKPV